MPNSLVNDNVRAIQEDLEGNLWVGTEGGLSVLAKGDSIFHTFEFSPGSADGLPNNFILDLFLSSSGKLWIGTGKGLCELLPEGRIAKSKFRTYTYVDEGRDFDDQNWVIQISEFR